jgi:nitrilase
MTDSALRVAAIQMTTGDDPRENLTCARRLLGEAAAAGARLAVLPENFSFMGATDVEKLGFAEDAGDGPLQRAVAEMARSLGLWIVAGTLPLRAPEQPGKVYAASLVFDPAGHCVSRYDKIHLFDVEVMGTERYRESGTIAPGGLEAVTVATPHGRLGLSVCYDVRFPELYRLLVAAGAEILCVPSAFTFKTGQAHWEVLLRARAIENQCYVIAPGQTGTHPGGRSTWGHSMIVDPWGRILSQVEDGPGFAIAELPMTPLQDLRRRFPALAHRRISI